MPRLCSLEQEMLAQFRNTSDEVAEGLNSLTRDRKTNFNYLLLDPRSLDTRNWKDYLASVVYTGKGSGSRPLHHLVEAVRENKTEKSKKIREIWAAGSGVVVLQVFHHALPVEALTREAAMIEAAMIECQNLTNVYAGTYYGSASFWSMERKLELGTFLLYKTFKILFQEGMSQIRPWDLQIKITEEEKRALERERETARKDAEWTVSPGTALESPAQSEQIKTAGDFVFIRVLLD